MDSQGSVKLLLRLLVLSLLTGCAAVADKDRDFEFDRPHEARRQMPDDLRTSNSLLEKSSDQAGNGTRLIQQSAKPTLNRIPDVQTVQFIELVEEGPSPPPLPEMFGDGQLLTSIASQAEGSFSINLPTALRLAGANNLQIAFAAEQVHQAFARVDAADLLWVPSLNAGIIYNSHSGRIQDTEGEVIEVSRNSLFVGGGAVIGNSPVTGGSGGPARMFVDLPLVDVLFEPLAARQAAESAEANQTVAFNDTLLATALAYLNLVRANTLVVVSEEAATNTEELVQLTEDFARSGQGLQADADRAKAELGSRRRDLIQAQESVAVTSAELARLLRLDPATRLIPTETQPVRLQLVDPNSDVYELIGQAQNCRPELARASAAVQEALYRTRQECWRPFLPHLYAGVSAGGFGGAPGSSVNNFSDRTDFDIGAIWQVQNLGLGNRARQSERDSLHRQTYFVFDSLNDRVAMEVTQAYEQVRHRDRQIETTKPQVMSAAKALKLNLVGIRGNVLRPIEIQQAIGALANARRQYLDAIIDHNRAQFALLRAIGRPPTATDTFQ